MWSESGQAVAADELLIGPDISAGAGPRPRRPGVGMAVHLLSMLAWAAVNCVVTSPRIPLLFPALRYVSRSSGFGWFDVG